MAEEKRYISEIQITDSIPIGLNKFNWQLNKGLNVITGLNGAGKTKLLKHIYGLNRSKYEMRYIDINYKPPIYKQVNELDSYSRTIEGKILRPNGSNTNWESDTGSITDNYFPDIDKDILKEIMVLRHQFLSQRKDEDNEFIAEEKWTGLTPWKDINNVLTTFGLEVQLEKNNLGGVISFFKEGVKSYDPSELSSGEQVAFALALWQWGVSVNKKSEILLIDEFGAHLNPSLMKHYMNVIVEHFVKKGVQVIMTTHNPLIANLVKEDELFWMDNGKIISKKKNKIVNILSDGLFSARNLQGIFDLFGTTGEKPEKILLVEGKDDELTMLREGIDNKINILDCKGAQNMPMFCVLPYAHINNEEKKPLIICLLDHDDKGIKVKAELEGLIVNNETGGNVLKILFVSNVKGDRMEEVLKDGNKKNNLISEINGAVR